MVLMRTCSALLSAQRLSSSVMRVHASITVLALEAITPSSSGSISRRPLNEASIPAFSGLALSRIFSACCVRSTLRSNTCICEVMFTRRKPLRDFSAASICTSALSCKCSSRRFLSCRRAIILTVFILHFANGHHQPFWLSVYPSIASAACFTTDGRFFAASAAILRHSASASAFA